MEIERVRRPFWMHQVIEYLVGIGLISASVQLPEPAVPSLLGLLIIINAAVAKGSAGAFRLVGHRLHHTLDLVVIGVLVVCAVQPWVAIDGTGRLMIGGIAFVLWFVSFHTDYTERASRSERRASKAADKEARGPIDSAEIGRHAGRLVGGAVHSAKRWRAGANAEPSPNGRSGDRPADASPAPWDPPSPP